MFAEGFKVCLVGWSRFAVSTSCGKFLAIIRYKNECSLSRSSDRENCLCSSEDLEQENRKSAEV